MKIIGISRVRNEEAIITNTLNHVSAYVNEIIVYDDASDDNTVKLCKMHPKVAFVIQGKKWNNTPKGRNIAEGKLRQIAYKAAVERGADWVYYFDADEYIEIEKLDFKCDAYYFRLFDFYITPEDVDLHYLERKYMGPEYRDIPMLFKVRPNILFTQRVPMGIGKNVKFGGFVKHFGKAISIDEWEKTCHYYTTYRWKGVNAELYKRWMSRKGKAIHIASDFRRPLITWDERYDDKKIVNIGL